MIRALREFLAILNRPCREHTEIYSRALDGEQRRIAMIGVRIHMLYCKSCRRFNTQMRRLRALTSRLGDELRTGESVPADVRERIARNLGSGPEKI